MLVVLATTCASHLLLTKTKFGQTLRRPCGSTRDGRGTSVRNSVSSFFFGQRQKESPQAFLMKALDLRQQILFLSSDESDDMYLQYDSEHIQRLFLRSVETGL